MQTMHLNSESHWIPLNQEKLHLKRFYSNPEGAPVFLLHGHMSSGRIFYSLSGEKGLAPYLARQGFDVYVADLHGRGKSTPPIARGSRNSQFDVITAEIPAFIAKIQSIRGAVPIHSATHSWGGVLLHAYIARTRNHPLASMVCFGTKRSIGWKNHRRVLPVDVAWNGLGRIATLIKGYLPAKALTMGSDNETTPMYLQSRYWVYRRENWVDPKDGFNYTHAFKNHPNKVRTLHLAGQNDQYLGHPLDVLHFMHELNNPADQYALMARATGYSLDYDHINMCTAPQAVNEQFKQCAQWFEPT